MPIQIHGAGLGLRSEHLNYIVNNDTNVPWFEILADNYICDDISPDSIFFQNLLKVTNKYPITLHCVGMSLGSAKEINFNYLNKLKKIIELTNPVYISDHLSWGNIGKYNSHELLPLPFINESLEIIVKNIIDTQNFLGTKILIENVSSYVAFNDSNFKEWHFLNKVSELSGCGILLDINNIYVNSVNHKFDPIDFINNINKDSVKYFHIAGHEPYEENKEYLIDTHGKEVSKPVWNLLELAINSLGNKPCLLERDNNIPSFFDIEIERLKIHRILNKSKSKENEIV